MASAIDGGKAIYHADGCEEWALRAVSAIRHRDYGLYGSMRDYVNATLKANADDAEALGALAFVAMMRIAQVIERAECGMDLTGHALNRDEHNGVNFAAAILAS